MKKLVIIPLILLAGLSAEAKNLSEQDSVKIAQDSFQVIQDKVHDIQQNLQLKGATYSVKKYDEILGYYFITAKFGEYDNSLTVTIDVVGPQSWGAPNGTNSRTFSYEVKNNEVIVAKYGRLVISDDAKYLTQYPFDGLPLRLARN